MKIFFAIPSYRGTGCVQFKDSLTSTYELLTEKGHECMAPHFLVGCCYIQAARNDLVYEFLKRTDADVLFFLDDDISWDPQDVLRLVEMGDDIVAGIYPKKTMKEEYPVVIKTDKSGYPANIREDGSLEAALLPTGFLRIKRKPLERMYEAYASLLGFSKNEKGQELTGYVDLFPQGVQEGRWWGEDFAFCRLWQGLEGKLWVVPDINLTHWHGDFPHAGNYHDFLLRQPGGSDYNKFNLAKTIEIPGWMTVPELEWLAQQGTTHNSIVELGSCLGRSTRALVDNTPGKVYAIDHWNGPNEMDWDSEVREALYPAFQAHLRDRIEEGKCIPVKKDHSEVTGDEVPEPDMVFIDGDHSYAAVKRDIETWKAKMKPGSLLCGHDSHWAGVKQALSELLPQAQTAPNTSIWFQQI